MDKVKHVCVKKVQSSPGLLKSITKVGVFESVKNKILFDAAQSPIGFCFNGKAMGADVLPCLRAVIPS